MLGRMNEIAKHVAEFRSVAPTRDVRRTIDGLLREYQSLSDALGGDDPAGLAVANSSDPAVSGDDGGIASAPPVPTGCTSSTSSFSNAVSTPVPNATANSVYSSTINVAGLDPVIWGCKCDDVHHPH